MLVLSSERADVDPSNPTVDIFATHGGGVLIPWRLETVSWGCR